jgi:hypothetical protein
MDDCKEQGIAMLIALLVIVALTGAGFFAVRTTRFEIASSGNQRLATQARYLSELGMMRTQHEWGRRYNRYQDLQRFYNLQDYIFSIGHFPREQNILLDPGSATHPENRSLGRGTYVGDFEVRVHDGFDTTEFVSGHDVGRYCFKRYTFTSHGMLWEPDPLRPEARAMNVHWGTISSIRSHAKVVAFCGQD